MPVLALEREQVKQIVAELQKLARSLSSYPQGSGSGRTEAPAQTIVTSLESINRTVAEGARQGALQPAQFVAIGHDFEKIGQTLVGLGSKKG